AQGQAGFDVPGRAVAAALVVAEALLAGLRARALGIELFPGAEAAIGKPLGEHPLRIGAVALEVGPLKERPFVPGDPEPAEPIENHLRVRLGAALAVGVLDAQDEGSLGLPD